MMDKNELEKFAKAVLEERDKGNVVVLGIEGAEVYKLDEFISQPTDGLLYDLNRLPEVVLTWLDNEEYGSKWVDDFAVCLVIKRLKERIDILENEIKRVMKG